MAVLVNNRETLRCGAAEINQGFFKSWSKKMIDWEKISLQCQEQIQADPWAMSQTRAEMPPNPGWALSNAPNNKGRNVPGLSPHRGDTPMSPGLGQRCQRFSWAERGWGSLSSHHSHGLPAACSRQINKKAGLFIYEECLISPDTGEKGKLADLSNN